MDGPTLELPHWQTAYESADETGVSFVLPTGVSREVTAGSGYAVVAGVFGECVVSIAIDAIAAGSFQPLPLRKDCQLDFEEFDGMWGWKDYIRNLPVVRLPR